MAVSMMGSSVIDSHISPCLCVDSLTSKSHMNHTKSEHKSMGKMQFVRSCSMGLTSSFIHSKYFAKTPLKKQRKAKGLVIVNELGGQYEDTFRDVQAVRNLC